MSELEPNKKYIGPSLLEFSEIGKVKVKNPKFGAHLEESEDCRFYFVRCQELNLENGMLKNDANMWKALYFKDCPKDNQTVDEDGVDYRGIIKHD
jgi:hypothetical protein